MAIGIALDRRVIAVLLGIAVTRLHRPTDTKVEWQAQDCGTIGNACRSGIGRSVIHNKDVVFLGLKMDIPNNRSDRAGFIKCRDNDENTLNR